MTEKELLILVDWIIHRLWIWQEDDDDDTVETIQALQVVLIPYLNQINKGMEKVSRKELAEWQDKTIELIKNDDDLQSILKEYNLELLFETNKKGDMS